MSDKTKDNFFTREPNKFIQYIGSRKCGLHLVILGLVWLIVGVMPIGLNVIYYMPEVRYTALGQVIPPSFLPEWNFWVHRIAVDPLIKVGAIPVILLMVLLVMRFFLEIKKAKVTTIETILKSEGAQEAHDGFWGWETSYTNKEGKVNE